MEWATLAFTDPDGITLYALAPDDGARGIVLGERHELPTVLGALTRLIETGQADETTHRLDERLGYRWLGVSEAAREYGLSVDSVRWAAREGRIRLAEKQGHDWRFPQMTFLTWLRNDHRPRENRLNAVVARADELTDGGRNDPSESDAA